MTGGLLRRRLRTGSLRWGVLWCCWLGLAAPAAGADGPATVQHLLSHGPRSRPRVALTFDVCQTPGHPSGFDRAIIDLLTAEAVPATFFLGGDWIRTHPAEARQLAASPLFELGNHSWSHSDLRRLDGPAIRAEVERTETALRQLRGYSAHLFRLPFGYFDDRVLAELGPDLRVIQWDLVSGDPDPGVSAAAMVTAVTRSLRNGSIVVMHANGRGRHTAAALPGILEFLRRRGFEPVTVSTLLEE